MADQLFFCEIVSPVQWLARRFTNALIFKTNSTYGTIPPLLNRLAPLDQDGVVSGPRHRRLSCRAAHRRPRVIADVGFRPRRQVSICVLRKFWTFSQPN